jgi:hypothetical protein
VILPFVGQVGNLRADCQSAQTARVNNPPQDDILPHSLKLTYTRQLIEVNATVKLKLPFGASSTGSILFRKARSVSIQSAL